MTLKFPNCDCSFEAKSVDKIFFNPNIEDIPLNCSATWDLISSGNTKGVFQLESRLGQMLSKKLKPHNIEHLAALVAIMRPGVLESMRPNAEGTMMSVTEHYIARKNGLEPVTYFHPALEHSLGKTFGEMIYQEQAMQITRDIAGFDLQQADILRKAIGKKKADIMAEVKTEFLAGTKEAGIVEQDVAEQIFDWIEKSQRYSFNKSHAVSYAINAYLSAYAKAHFKKQFFTSYLYYAKEKQKPHIEINELINNAKVVDVDVRPPDLRRLNNHFRLIDNDIYFGFTDIKGVGNSVTTRLGNHIQVIQNRLKKSINDWSWSDFLIFVSPFINKTAVEALIKVGALQWMGKPRQLMWFEFEQYNKLSTRERNWIEKQYINNELSDISLKDILVMLLSSPVGRLGGIANINRVTKINDIANLVDNPPMLLTDSPAWISAVEEALLGISITCTIVDECEKAVANTTCRDFISGVTSKDGILMAVKIDEVKEISTKRGQNVGSKMAFLSVSDNSALLESVVLFPNVWSQHKSKLFVDNTVMLAGASGRERDSFVVTKVWQI